MPAPRKPIHSLVVKSSAALSSQSRRIVLAGADDQCLFERELRAVELTGVLRDHRTARACNIIESVLDDFRAERVNFERCDFKDNAIRGSRFSDANFGSSSMAYNTVLKTVFERCSFHDTDIQNCEFDQTVFVDCDLRFLLIKACSFTRCEFRGCQTNNQVFEMCRLTDSVFVKTELQIQTVAENFGIVATKYDGLLRDGRADGPHTKMEVNRIARMLRASEAPPLQKLNLQYFLEGTLLDGTHHVDDAIDLGSWMRMFRTAGSFAVVLNRWVEFLLGLYERDQLTIHAIIRMHSMTDGLLRGLGDSTPHHQTIAAINGVHLSLSRIVDQYLVALEQCTGIADKEVSFLVEGHQHRRYYYRVLQPLFARTPARITKLVRHNSPWDLGLTFSQGSNVMLFMALFLATRTRIELNRISRKVEERSLAGPPASTAGRRKRVSSSSSDVPTESLVAVEFGGGGKLRESPQLRLKAYLPGNLIAELKLDIAASKIAKLRKVVKDLL